MSDTDQKFESIIKELLDVEDKSELAMRSAYIIVSRDKYLAEPKTKYDIEIVVDPVSKKEKTRIILEVEE